MKLLYKNIFFALKSKILSISLDNYVLMIAGIFITVSTLLGYFSNKYWLFFTIFVGINLFQYSFTGFCPLRIILKKLGIGSE